MTTLTKGSAVRLPDGERGTVISVEGPVARVYRHGDGATQSVEVDRLTPRPPASRLTREAPDEERCAKHPAYEPDYCPVCGTTTPITERRF